MTATDALATIRITGTVFGGGGVPVSRAVIETWQARPNGWFADDPRSDRHTRRPGFRCFALSGGVADDGPYEIITVKPGLASGIHGVRQAPHIVVSITAPRLLDRCLTRIYFADEPEANAVDPLLACISADRRRALLAQPGPSGYRHDIYLHGEQSTLLFGV